MREVVGSEKDVANCSQDGIISYILILDTHIPAHNPWRPSVTFSIEIQQSRKGADVSSGSILTPSFAGMHPDTHDGNNAETDGVK